MKYNMIRSIPVASAAAASLLCAMGAQAADPAAEKALSKTDQVAAALVERMPNFTDAEVKESTIPNLYEVAVGGGTAVYYMSEDARYVIQGDMIDLETRENVTEMRRSGARLSLMSELDPESTVVFAPEGKPVEHSITVFTDIDCGYCRKLHQEIAQLNDLGIKVSYALYPRSGPNSPSWTKAVEVFCADDRNAALTNAKAGIDVQAESCETDAVDKGWNVGRNAGVTGTPAIVTESGYLIGGYLPAPQLKARLEQIAGGNES